MSAVRRLVLGTHNAHKAEEIKFLLQPRGFELFTLADLEDAIEVEENGATFAENAALKASQQARHLRSWVLAEDSGLLVDALNGQPGVFSARYSGEDATDATNNALLLENLEQFAPEGRTARYLCHAALADPAGIIRLEHEGGCEGRILHAPRGEAGFGYDPLFEIAEYHQTFAELGDTVKSILSHRGRALRGLIPKLVALAESGCWPPNGR